MNPILSLHEIHLATDISKPSLLRILHTLEQFGMVSRRLADGHYRISTVARTARKRDRYDRVAEAAAPILDRLCHKLSWPSDLFVPAGDHMERRETSRLQTPYFSHPSYLTRVGQPVNWLMTGVGRAYLAFCPAQERDAIIQTASQIGSVRRSVGARPEASRKNSRRDACQRLRHARSRFRRRHLPCSHGRWTCGHRRPAP